MLDLLDEIDGNLRMVMVRWPETFHIIRPQQKHVRHALESGEDQKKVLSKTRGWMIATMVKYPELDEYLRPLANRIAEELGDKARL